MASPGSKDVWAAGKAYEPYVGRWSRLVAREFLAWLDMPAGASWLDVGCGTGALSATILATAQPKAVLGIDPSEGLLAVAREQVQDGRATFKIGDAQTLSIETESLDCAVSGLVLNFVPKPERAADEIVRVLKPGGTAAAYVWDYAGEMQLMRHFWEAAVALDPAAQALDEGRRFPLCQPGPLSDLFKGAGLERVETRAIDVPTVFRDFEDYWSPFLGGQGPAPGYAMSLPEAQRAELRERVRTGLPVEKDGSIRLIARAWVVRGLRL